MPNVYTRGGDKGDTGLFGGSRTAKNDIRVDAYGTMDEANASIGFARAISSNCEISDILLNCQKRIFVLGAELASDARGRDMLKDKISQQDVDLMEKEIDAYLAIVGKQTEFVVPGEEPVSAALHTARTVVRRAERRIIDYMQEDPGAVRPELLKYVNRLSDLLFVLARYLEESTQVRKAVKKVLEALNIQDGTPQIDEPGEESFLALAKRMAKGARIKARELNVPIVFAAVDKYGNPAYMEREAESLIASIDIAQNKAYSAAALKVPTELLGELSKESGSLFGLQNTNGGRIVIFGGGYPVVRNGEIVGAIGVSGGTAEEDMAIATAGLKVLD